MFVQGFLKTAAARSEMVGKVVNPINYAIGAPAAAIGFLVGPYSEEDRKKVNGKSWSNVLIPGAGPYRLGRRFVGLGLDKDERPKHKVKGKK